MKESLFEILLNLFETALLRLKEVTDSEGDQTPANEQQVKFLANSGKISPGVFHMVVVKAASDKAIRVFTGDEQMKLTKASYQFLMRLSSWGIISHEIMELIINRLLLSDSSLVSLRETKWVIRSLLADKLSLDQLAYLDLVLYHKEDAIVRH